MSQPTSEPVQPLIVAVPATAIDPDRSPRWLTREGRLWLAAAVIMMIAGLFKGINLLILLAYLLMGLWIVNWWLVDRRDLRRVRASRHFADPLVAGVKGERRIELFCEEGTPPPRGWTIEDRCAGQLFAWMIIDVPAGQTVTLRHTLQINQRGRHACEPLLAWTRYPFGLLQRVVELTPAEEIVVLPQLGIVQIDRLKQWLARSARGDGRLRRRIRHATVQEADIHGLREFRLGDSPRWIHWPSSARRSQLLVREFEDTTPPNLLLIVDPWLGPQATDEQRQNLEWLVSLAGTICREWCRELGGRLILLIASDPPEILDGATSAEFALRCLQALAVQQGRAEEFDFRLESMPRAAMGMPTLVLNSRPEGGTEARVEMELGRPVAAVRPGESLDWYLPPVLIPPETSVG